MARTLASVPLRVAAWPHPGDREAGNHGIFSTRRNQSIDQYDGDRGGCGCGKRDGDARRECGAFWVGAAPSTSRTDRPRRAQVVLYFAEFGSIEGDSSETGRARKNKQWL